MWHMYTQDVPLAKIIDKQYRYPVLAPINHSRSSNKQLSEF